MVVRVIEGVALRDGEELEEGEPEAEGDLDSGVGIGRGGQPGRNRMLRSHCCSPSSNENAPKHATDEFRRRAHQAPFAPTMIENCPAGGASAGAPGPKHATSQVRLSPQAVAPPSVTMMRRAYAGSGGQRGPQQLTFPAVFREKVAPPPLCAIRTCAVSGGVPLAEPQHIARLPVVTPHAWPTPTDTVAKSCAGGEHAPSLEALPSSAPL